MPELGTAAMWAIHIEPDDESEYAIRYDHPDIVRERENRSKQKLLAVTECESEEFNSGKASESEKALRINQQIRITCQQIACEIWKNEPNRTIASIVRDELVQKYGGARHYEDETVREWIKEVAPSEVRSRRGRPRKNGGE